LRQELKRHFNAACAHFVHRRAPRAIVATFRTHAEQDLRDRHFSALPIVRLSTNRHPSPHSGSRSAQDISQPISPGLSINNPRRDLRHEEVLP
jgi:hypothetical protein